MYKAVSIILVLCVVSSCIDPPPPRLNKAYRKQLDSLYSASIDSLDLIAEEDCNEKHVSIYQSAIDSIQELRKEEIESILGQ